MSTLHVDDAVDLLISPSRISLPRKGRRVGLHIVLFEACLAFTRVAARTLARSPIRDPLYRRLQPFCYLHDCSGSFRLERISRVGLAPTGTRRLSRRTPKAVIVCGEGGPDSFGAKCDVECTVPPSYPDQVPGGLPRRVAIGKIIDDANRDDCGTVS
jgi:hypothetical protein